MRAGPSCRKPQAASMGSSGSSSMVTSFSLAKVTKTLPPGLSPIFSRISAGMTTWPLAEVLTIGIYVSLCSRTLNVASESVTLDYESGKNNPGKGLSSNELERLSSPDALCSL